MKLKFIVAAYIIVTTIEASWSSAIDIVDRIPFYRKDYQFESRQEAFYKLHRAGKTWTQALSTCEHEGAHLVVPETTSEVEVIILLMKNKISDNQGVFVGIHDLFVEGTFVTWDGKDINDVWSEWRAYEPNDSNGKEDCVMLGQDGKYNDRDCNSPQPFICKKTLATLTPNTVCETTDLAYFPDKCNRKCYKLHTEPKNWSDAYSICHAEQSYLAIINSEEEAKLLVEEFAKHPANKLTGNFRKEWLLLGFHDRFTEGEFTTIKGEPLSKTGYTKWSAGQPDDYGNEDCGSMLRDGTMNDLPCDMVALFACERDLRLATDCA